jgi:hypothetical protein
MPGDPHSGSKLWKASDREIGKPDEKRGKVILEPASPNLDALGCNKSFRHFLRVPKLAIGAVGFHTITSEP